MVSDLVDNESNVRVNRKMELVTVPESSGGNAMIGICYLVKEDADIVEERIEELCKNQRYDESFWEEALYNKDRMIVAARVVHSADVVEINTYEQLREIDSDSNQLKTDAIQVICEALKAKAEEVTDITVLKKGIAAYFTEGCSDETRIKIYCYIAACGLLWSNWCEYKRNLGVEFGEYSLRQYRYAKDYYRIVQEELKKQGEEK